MSVHSQRGKIRRRPDSPVALNQSGSDSVKRTSVFERLGSRPVSVSKLPSNSGYERSSTKDASEPRKVITSRKTSLEPDENDLRHRVRHRSKPISPPDSGRRPISPMSPKSPRYDSKKPSNRSLSPSSGHKDETRIKSLISMVSAPSSRGSPTSSRHRNEAGFSHYKRTTGDGKHPSKYEDCEDEEELERKRQQLQKELELEIEREKRELQKGGTRNVGSRTGTCSTSESRSLCSSAASSASGSYTSTDASYSKSGSSCSHSSDQHHVKAKRQSPSRNSGISPLRVSRRSPHLSSSRSTAQRRSRSPRTPPRSLSSSSLPKRGRPTSPAHNVTKNSDVKLDRHGNVRISLRERERQRRMARDQVFRRSRSPTRSDRKDVLVDSQKLSRSDTKSRPSSISGSRSEPRRTSPPLTYSRPRSPRRSRESTPERRRLDDRRRYEERDYDRERRYEATKEGKDLYRREVSKSSESKYRREDRGPPRPKTPPPHLKPLRSEEESRSHSRRDYEDHRDRSLPSPVLRPYSRSPPPSTHSYEVRKRKYLRSETSREPATWDPNSRESSLGAPFPIKSSRASSVGSASSRRSHTKPKASHSTRDSVVSSDPLSVNDHSVHSCKSSLKADVSSPSNKLTLDELPATKLNITLHSTEDMSPISNDSSFGDLDEVSPETNNDPIVEKKETPTNEQRELKKNDGFISEENYSDWSDGDDELLLQAGNHEDFETVDEVGSVSSRTQDKELGAFQEVQYNKPSVVDTTVIDSQDAFSTVQDDALEAISDDELDAIIGESEPLDACHESQHSVSGQQMLDALEIDWSSLASKPQAQVCSSGAARKRFLPANILTTIGFSHALAGPQLTEKIINYCKQEQKENFVPFKHPVASLHCRINEQLEQRNNMFGKTGSNTTALNAKKDLQLRRFLDRAIPFSDDSIKKDFLSGS